jgi:hypothetical protein
MGPGGRGKWYMSELSGFMDNVDCLKRLFDWSRYVWCVKEVGFDLIDKLVSNPGNEELLARLE